MIDRILKLMHEKSVSAYQLTADLGINHGAVTDWKKGKAKPSTDAIIKIAQYFDVSTDYLLTGREPDSRTAPTLDALLAKEGITDDYVKQSIKSLIELAKRAERNAEIADELAPKEYGGK